MRHVSLFAMRPPLARRHPLLLGEWLAEKDAIKKSARKVSGTARRRLSNRKPDADEDIASSASDSDDESSVRLYSL